MRFAPGHTYNHLFKADVLLMAPNLRRLPLVLLVRGIFISEGVDVAEVYRHLRQAHLD